MRGRGEAKLHFAASHTHPQSIKMRTEPSFRRHDRGPPPCVPAPMSGVTETERPRAPVDGSAIITFFFGGTLREVIPGGGTLVTL